MFSLMAIRDEQAVFDAMRDDLVNDPATAGKYIVIFGGEVVGFFETFVQGHRAGLQRFGTQVAFLVQRVEPRPLPVIVYWS
jgi:hypothetical protein